MRGSSNIFDPTRRCRLGICSMSVPRSPDRCPELRANAVYCGCLARTLRRRSTDDSWMVKSGYNFERYVSLASDQPHNLFYGRASIDLLLGTVLAAGNTSLGGATISTARSVCGSRA